MEQQDDARIVWVREKPGRQIIQMIEAMPVGFSVTTKWIENGQVVRQDCEVAIRDVASDGAAKEMGQRAVPAS